MVDISQADAHADAISKEYGMYVAVEPIDVGAARAFNVGDPVPASHVDRGVVPSSAVARTTTKAAAAAVTEKGV